MSNSKTCVRLLRISLEDELELFPCWTIFLIAFPVFLHSLTFLISNCLNLLFGIQERSRRLKPFSTNKKWGRLRGFYTWEGPIGSCLVSISPLSLILLNLEGNWEQDKKENKVWDRLIINSAGEFSFMGIQFQTQWSNVSAHRSHESGPLICLLWGGTSGELSYQDGMLSFIAGGQSGDCYGLKWEILSPKD